MPKDKRNVKKYKQGRKAMVTKKKTMNPWMKHLTAVRKENPKMTLTEAMKKAKRSYKK